MEARRKAEIIKIQDKKNKTIGDLKEKHDRKYQEIHDYYNDITRLNMDMITTLRADFKAEKNNEARANREKMIESAANDEIVKPLDKVRKDIIHLQERYLENEKVRENLSEVQQRIVRAQREYANEEWQYEVLHQQYHYIE